MAAHTTDARWVLREAGLEYQFAGRRIARARFRARVSQVSFADLPSDPDDREGLDQLAHGSLAQQYSHPVSRPLPRLALIDGKLRYVPRHYRRYLVHTVGPFGAYLAGFSPKTRQTIKRKVRRFCALAGSTSPLDAFATRSELLQFHHRAREVSRSTYQERLLGAGLPATPAYIDEAFDRGEEARGFLLMTGSTPVAYLYTPIEAGVAVYTFVGYDPRYADWSPGTVLQYLALERMFADPAIRALDFAEGEAPHKALFSTGHVFCADIYYFRPTLRAWLAVGAHIGVGALDRLAASAARGLGLGAPIRRLLRGQPRRAA